MPTIRILPENLCNQIAAGEVVERPASVVKELVENALDAEATEITIEVEGGGRRLVRVSDNGVGMGKDDVFLCLERHGTSKIARSADLFSLTTLGFRGEALPSIAAVSRMCVQSRHAEALEGWEIAVEGGTVRRAGATGLPVGTTVEVRDLFFNTPARRKFLRKDETEFGHIAELVTRLALSAPEVQFRLYHNQRLLIDAPRHRQLPERVAALLGRPVLSSLAPVEQIDDAGLSLRGLISRPELSRSSATGMYTYINGRYVRDRVIQHAILEGVRHLLPRGRYPVAILFLAIAPDQVDVNVHPTKHEVRFSQQQAVHDFIAAAVRESLRGSGDAGGRAQELDTPAVPAARISGEQSSRGAFSFDPVRREIREPQEAYAASRSLPMAIPASSLPSFSPPLPSPPPWSATSPPETSGYFTGLRVIGQYRQSFILAEDEACNLILIDQHAAHERIGFERLRSDFRLQAVAQQALLFPQIVEFDYREAALLAEQLVLLARLGFDLEPFGGRSFVLKGVPQLLAAHTDFGTILRDITADLAELGVSNQIEDACDRVLVSMACHSMVRANHRLEPAEISALLRELDRIDFNACCPHGRPIQARLSEAEISRMFRRSA